MAISDGRQEQSLELPRQSIGRKQPVERRHPPPYLDLETVVPLARADLQRLVAGQAVVTPFWLAIGALCAAALLVRKRFSSRVEGEWTR